MAIVSILGAIEFEDNKAIADSPLSILLWRRVAAYVLS
jgi:hypothetical protein